MKNNEFGLSDFISEVEKFSIPVSYLSETQENKICLYKSIIDSELYDKIIWMSNESSNRVFMLFTANLFIFVSNYLNRDDISIATSISEENSDNQNSLKVILKYQLDRTKTFKNVIFDVNELMNQNREKNNDSFIAKNRLNEEKLNSEFFDIGIHLSYSKDYISNVDVNTKLLFCFTKCENCFELNVYYNLKFYNEVSITRLVEQYKRILNQTIYNVEIPINKIELISEREKHQILNVFNNTSIENVITNSIDQIFKEKVKQCSDKIAVVCNDNFLSYGELNRQTEDIGCKLKCLGVKNEDTVALYMDRSIEMIIGILSIIKAGAGYLPISLSNPLSRNKFILKETLPTLILTQKHLNWNAVDNNLIVYIEDLQNQSANMTTKLLSKNRIDSLAYIIYTSGSTGNPKGVMIEHRSVVNLIAGLSKEVYSHFTKDLHVSLIAPYEFDASVQQIFAALLLGHTLYIADNETRLDNDRLHNFFNKFQIDVSDGTPWHLRALNEVFKMNQTNRIPVKQFIIAGDVCHKNILRQLVKNLKNSFTPKISNLYGPTETCVDSSIFHIDLDNIRYYNSIPIGKPLFNQHIFIYDEEMKICPIGIAGEMYIGGNGVARGYFANKELTSLKFIENPYNKNEKLYKTGDLARWYDDGNIEFLGRRDEQIKIRGFRVEPLEIESQLRNHKDINETIIVTKKSKSGENYLIAYYVSNQELLVSDLRLFLDERLPNYMIPSFFKRITRVPLNSRGKINKNELPEISFTKANYSERSLIEKELIKIYSDILDIDENVIDKNSNFFELGGDSIKVLFIVSEIHKRFSVKIHVKDVYSNLKVGELVEFVNKSSITKYKIINKSELKEYYNLSSAQKRIFIEQQLNLNSTNYNIFGAYMFEGNINIRRLEDTFKELLNRHDILRTSFVIINENPVQIINHIENFRLNVIKNDSKKKIDETILELIQPFDLTKPPLIKATLIQIHSEKMMLVFDMHHILADGLSIPNLIRDIINIYEEKDFSLINLQYIDFSEWHNKFLKSIKNQEEFWISKFQNKLSPGLIPIDFERINRKSFTGKRIIHSLNNSQVHKLQEIANEEQVTPYMIFLTFLNILVHKYTGAQDIIIGTPTGGRNRLEFDMIGLFVNFLLMKNTVNIELNFLELLKEIKESVIQAFNNQDYQYDELIKKIGYKKGGDPFFNVVMAIDNFENKIIKTEHFKASFYEIETNTSKYDLRFGINIQPDRIFIELTYSDELYLLSTIEKILSRFAKIIDEVLKDVYVKVKDIKFDTQLIEVKGEVVNARGNFDF